MPTVSVAVVTESIILCSQILKLTTNMKCVMLNLIYITIQNVEVSSMYF